MEFRYGIVFYTLVLLFNVKHLSLAMSAPVINKEENCVLSFIVPRDKMKSSCDMDVKVKRHLNSMETKLHIYKQQVVDLQNQLDKERQLNYNKLQALENKINAFDAKENYHILQEKLENLEVKLYKGPGLMIKNGDSWKANGKHDDIKDTVYHKNMVEAIQPVVRAEVEKYLENFTQELDNTIRNDLTDYDLLNMIPRSDQSYSGSSSDEDLKRNRFDERKPNSKSSELWKDFDKIRNKMNNVGDDIASKVRKMIKNITLTQLTSTKVNNDNETSENSTTFETSVVENVTEKWTSTTDQNSAVEYVTVMDVISAQEDGDNTSTGTNAPEDKMLTEMTQIPNARISKTDAERQVDHLNLEQNDQSVDNAIRTDIFSEEIEKLVKNEVSKMLHAQMDEVESLMKKQKEWLDGSMGSQDKELKNLAESHSVDLKDVEEKVDGLKLEVSSITQSMQDFFSMAEVIHGLQRTVDEIKTNMSSSEVMNNEFIMEKVDEHSKILRKLDQLYRILQQTVQHYRNESKIDYFKIKEKLTEASEQFQQKTERMFQNVSLKFNQKMQDYNTRLQSRLQLINATIRNLDDNYVILNLDHTDLERRVKSKNSKISQDVESLKTKVDRLQQQNSRWKQIHKTLANDNHKLELKNNETTLLLTSIQLEMKLSSTDSWVEYNFLYDTTQTDCFGKQYIKKTHYRVGRIVGVVLCTNARYKILLAKSIDEKFLNIGDSSGLGEDHCEFIGAVVSTSITVSPPGMFMKSVEGFVRDNWGQEPKPTLLNFLRPSPSWYECGMSIP
ncbi:uncharacterized protein LOC121380575 [Gigantopelta aegis]|uniref:uncharacterized protein LOC121380575 n=1 Tax=Gigantopelta aegis TaxID=1735272 RepID=UPI001B8874C8|nr:uncharacterized protein LOC121380575 [Gigantopelta aegis]